MSSRCRKSWASDWCLLLYLTFFNKLNFINVKKKLLIPLLCLDSVVAPKDSCGQEADDEELAADHSEAQGTVCGSGVSDSFYVTGPCVTRA